MHGALQKLNLSPQQVLLLPGWQDSPALHWQSRWEQQYGFVRVQQHDWMRPLRGDWITRLQDVLLQTDQPVVLVAHSLGCQLVAAWAALSGHTHRVRAALLVAPGDVMQSDLRAALPSWAPPVLQRLPFASTVVTSQNDPYCSAQRASAYAAAWGSTLVNLGNAGHINADSALEDWPQGLALLAALLGAEK